MDVDWAAWRPTDVATLLFVRRGAELLLIRKKRGLGAGKINAPGGRLEPGETPEHAAVREVQEEVGVTPIAPRHRGELRFQFVDGYALHCHVFAADACEGEPRATDEADPLWIPVDRVPYEEMWADDALWLPRMLAGWGFDGRFTFDGDRMASHDLRLLDPAAALFARLDALGVAHRTVEHVPVFTVEQARAARAHADGLHVKNLFLRDQRGAMWLVTVPEDVPVDLHALAPRLDARRLSFGSVARLRAHLDVEPGAVTPFALLNDRSGSVRVALHAAVAAAPVVHVHPMTNDRTTRVSGVDIVRFLVDTGHRPVGV